MGFKSSKLRFGIELEYSIEWEIFKPIASRAVYDSYGWYAYYAKKDVFVSDYQTHRWHIKQDGYKQSELTTPISMVKDLNKIKKVINKLKKNKLVINSSDDGFHVHIDIGDIDNYHLLCMWLACEEAIFNCMPKNRHNNSSCPKLINRTCKNKWLGEILPDVMNRASGTCICFADYNERNTVEFRLAEGTLDSDFVTSWVRFLLAFVDSVHLTSPCLSVCVKPNSIGFYELIEQLKLDLRTQEIMSKRYERYKK